MSRARLAGVLGGALVAVLLAASGVGAANEIPTVISIAPLQSVTIGDRVTVAVELSAAGVPLADKPVSLTINGESRRVVRTDRDGRAIFRLPRDMAPGEYALVATFAGETSAYLASAARGTLVIVPFELEIGTVPALPGMAFELVGLDAEPRRFVAGEDGVARTAVDRPGSYVLNVIEDAYENPDQQAEFSRWTTEDFGPSIPIRIPNNNRLAAGFDIWHRVSQTFVDSDGGVVDPARISSLTVRNSIGTVLTYPDGQPRWYKASRIVRPPTGLQERPVHYTLDSVIVDGSNVVNTGQQRFVVAPNVSWRIPLLLFSAQLHATDLLLGVPIGDAVSVTYPDGRVVRIEAEADGEMWARWLARGVYRVTVADAPGWAPIMPMALSRDQVVELRVISYFDMATALFAAAGLAIGLLHVGRPHLIPRAVVAASAGVEALQRRRRSASQRPVAQPQVGVSRVVTQAAPSGSVQDAVTGSALAEGRPRQSILPALRPRQLPGATGRFAAPLGYVSRRVPVVGLSTAATPLPPVEPLTRQPATKDLWRGEAGDPAEPGLAPTAPTPNAELAPRAATSAGTRGKEPAGSTRTGTGAAGGASSSGTDTIAEAAATAGPTARSSARSKATQAPARSGREIKRESSAAPKATRTQKAASKASRRGPTTTPSRASASRKSPTAAAQRTPAPTSGAQPPAKAAARDGRKTKSRAAARTKAPHSSGALASPRQRRPGRGNGSSGRQVSTPRVPVVIDLKSDAVALEQRRRQLVLLGLEDPGQDPLPASSGPLVDVAGPDAPLEIGLCRGCGLPLWAGARFCRRCGQVQDAADADASPNDVAGGASPPEPQPAAAERGRSRRSRGGAAS